LDNKFIGIPDFVELLANMLCTAPQ